MRVFRGIVFIIALSLFHASLARANPFSELNWESGPTTGQIGDKATIRVPSGYVFLGSQDTQKFMELLQNIPGGNEYLFAPEDLSWFSIFTFNQTGFVKDNEQLNPEEILSSVRAGNEQANVEKVKRGWGTLTITGWAFQPRYDKETNLLEWAISAEDDSTQEPVVNYNTRLLGRKGVMEVVLVEEPVNLSGSVSELKSLLEGFEFDRGERYADFKQGDKVAAIGLAALITGGAAAVATKKGFWKFIVAGFVAFLAWLGSLFKSKK